MIMGAYCVGKVQVVFDNGSILCIIMIIGAYYVSKVYNMLPQ